MGIAYVKTTQARQLHCPCSFFCGSQHRLASCLPGEPQQLAVSWEPAHTLTHCSVPLPPSQGTSAELSPGNWFLTFFWVSCLPCPLCFCSETCCCFKALQQQVFDNLLVLSQVYIKAQQLSRISYCGCGTDFFSFRGVADLPSFPNISVIFKEHHYRKARAVLLSSLWDKTAPQAIGSVHCVIYEPVGRKKFGKIHSFIPEIGL